MYNCLQKKIKINGTFHFQSKGRRTLFCLLFFKVDKSQLCVYSSGTYAPDQILNSIFLPLMGDGRQYYSHFILIRYSAPSPSYLFSPGGIKYYVSLNPKIIFPM